MGSAVGITAWLQEVPSGFVYPQLWLIRICRGDNEISYNAECSCDSYCLMSFFTILYITTAKEMSTANSMASMIMILVI